MNPAGLAAAGTPRQRKWRTWPTEEIGGAGRGGAASAVGEVATGQRSRGQELRGVHRAGMPGPGRGRVGVDSSFL